MRRLLYVPILHTEADFGSLAEGIEERSKAVVGANHWQAHKEVIHLYWQEIARYWQGKDVTGFKIFQDAMPVDGSVGEKIVQSLASDGSINHKIVAYLIEHGAVLMKTEDAELLKEEYFLTKSLAQKRSLLGSLWALARYRFRKNRLLRARDSYMSKRIDESLQEGETGICFLGASHEVVRRLSGDIKVIALKDPQKVREYTQKIARRRVRSGVSDASKLIEGLNTLGHYLTMPIEEERRP